MSGLPFLSLFFERVATCSKSEQTGRYPLGKPSQELGTETFTRSRGEDGDTDVSDSDAVWEKSAI
jgi:hypothetical protein